MYLTDYLTIQKQKQKQRNNKNIGLCIHTKLYLYFLDSGNPNTQLVIVIIGKIQSEFFVLIGWNLT